MSTTSRPRRVSVRSSRASCRPMTPRRPDLRSNRSATGSRLGRVHGDDRLEPIEDTLALRAGGGLEEVGAHPPREYVVLSPADEPDLAPRARLGNPPQRRAEAQLGGHRSEEHTSELQSLMRISYAVFCLKKKKNK